MSDQSKKIDDLYKTLSAALAGNAAAIRCRTELQPAAGVGTKVFPPTHSEGKYAMESRQLPGVAEPVQCVLLDSVQSQANRIEDALQDAVDRGAITLPLIAVEFGDKVADIQRVTSLQAPHRAADAILRDSLVDEKGKAVPFRQSTMGKRITDSSLSNATPLFEFCPHALFLGVWDSTGPKGGLGAKFARAVVSEIVGIDAVMGKKTASRIDPLQTRAAAKVIKEKDGSWRMAKDDKAKGAVSPSEINHGNIPPDVTDGGVTVSKAEHSAVISFPQLRRLRFPLNGGLAEPKKQAEIDTAARTVLLSLSLVGLTLAAERGFDLRSRCLLFPTGPLSFELLETPGKPTSLTIDSATAIGVYETAVKAAVNLGLPWNTETIVLTPSAQLIELILRSQAIAAISAEGGGE